MTPPRILHGIQTGRAHDQACSVDLRRGLGDLDLGALKVAQPGVVVGGNAMTDDLRIIVETRLRVPQRDAGEDVGKQREYRERIQRVRIELASRRRTAVKIA